MVLNIDDVYLLIVQNYFSTITYEIS